MSDRLDRAEELFHAALAQAPEGRAAFLEAACAGDGSLGAMVERLLAADGAVAGGWLEREGALDGGPPLAPGTVLGNFAILRRIGQGGMGTVYAARQAAPQREVALKVVRPDRLTRRALRRFRHEAEILGSLQHGGIAQVFEAGTASLQGPDGETREQPYIAMELVHGAPLLEYARERGLGRRARIELVARVADAVHHAHQRGVIHRDLKPANVLVLPGEPGQPKVLDFGIARFVGAHVRTLALETGPGQLLGTLAYMSPEQLEGGHQDVDLRADVYAIGVLLYELIVGHPPFEQGDLPLAQAIRRAASSEVPSPRAAIPDLDEDVAAIALQALDREKERRYQSAAALAADLRNYLAGRPVEARAASALYLLRRRLRRHRTLLAAGGLVLALVSAFAVVASLQARANRRLADRVRGELQFSNIERGRALGAEGNRLGENLIWSALLAEPGSTHARWALWEYYARNPCLAARQVEPGTASVVAFHPRGEWLVAGGADGLLRLLDPLRLADLRRLPPAPGEVWALAVSPDGRRVAAGCLGGELGLWDVESGSVERLWNAHVDRVTSIDFAPDGTRLATGSLDGSTAVWDLASGAELARWERPQENVWSVRFAPDGAQLAVGADELELWPAPFAGPPRIVPGHGGPVVCATFGPRGELLYSGSQDRSMRVWDLPEGRPRHVLHPHNGTIRWLRASADGSALTLSGWWRTERWTSGSWERRAATPHFEAVEMGGVDLHPGRDLLVTASDDDILRAWELGSQVGTRSLGGHEGRVCHALAPGGDLLVSGDSSGHLRAWAIPAGRLQWEADAHAGRVKAIAVRPGGAQVASVGEDDRLVVRDLASGAALWSLDAINPGTSLSLAYSPDGSTLAVAHEDDGFHLLEARTGAERLRLPARGSEALSIAFSPGGERIATVSREGGLDLWTADGAHVALLEPEQAAWTVGFAPDGRRIVVGTWGRSVEVWDVRELRRVAKLEGHDATVWDVAFHPVHGDLLVSGAGDGTIRLWDLVSGLELLCLRSEPEADVIDVSFDGEGRTLVASGAGPTVRLWDLEYFERHIAGNLELQLRRVAGDEGLADPAALRAWAAEVLARPWPRWPGAGE